MLVLNLGSSTMEVGELIFLCHKINAHFTAGWQEIKKIMHKVISTTNTLSKFWLSLSSSPSSSLLLREAINNYLYAYLQAGWEMHHGGSKSWEIFKRYQRFLKCPEGEGYFSEEELQDQILWYRSPGSLSQLCTDPCDDANRKDPCLAGVPNQSLAYSFSRALALKPQCTSELLKRLDWKMKSPGPGPRDSD